MNKKLSFPLVSSLILLSLIAKVCLASVTIEGEAINLKLTSCKPIENSTKFVALFNYGAPKFVSDNGATNAIVFKDRKTCDVLKNAYKILKLKYSYDTESKITSFISAVINPATPYSNQVLTVQEN